MFCIPVFNMGDFTVNAAADNVLSAAFVLPESGRFISAADIAVNGESRRSNVTLRSSAFLL